MGKKRTGNEAVQEEYPTGLEALPENVMPESEPPGEKERTGQESLSDGERGQGASEDDLMEEFRRLNRMELVGKMAAELPEIRKIVGISDGGVAGKIGMEPKKYKAVEKGLRDLQWPEYMSLLFLFWNNETGRDVIEEKGLFPDAMKRAFSINRNAHAPSSETD